MKIKSLFVAVLLVAGVVVAPSSVAADYEWPKAESFTVTPIDIDEEGYFVLAV